MRSRRASPTRGIKAMIPMGRPFLDYVLSGLADAGLKLVCLVVGPEHGVVQDRYAHAAPPRRVKVAFAVHAELRLNTLHTGTSLLSKELHLASDNTTNKLSEIIATPRIGVDYAGEDALLPYRFILKDNPYVSKMPKKK